MFMFFGLVGGSLVVLVCIMFCITDGSIYALDTTAFINTTKLVSIAENLNKLIVAAKDTNTLDKSTESSNTLVATKNLNTLELIITANNTMVTTTENTESPAATTKNLNTLFTTTKNFNTLGTTAENTKVTDNPKTMQDAMVTTVKTASRTTKKPYNNISELKYTRFAIVSSYWEQQTNAILNMWSLQKWAKFTGFNVLEPFAFQSTLGLTDQILYQYNFTNVLHFSDYFDLGLWTNKIKKNYGIPPFNNWKMFELSPLKKAVVVILVYDVLPVGEYMGDDINKHHDCVEHKKEFYSQHSKLFDKLQIQVVRNVCFVFNYLAKSPITLSQFNSFILLNNNVNIWFSVWRGIQFDRIAVMDHKNLLRDYGGEGNILAMVRTSQRVLRDSRKYVNTVLKVNFQEYTAIAFRTGNRRTALVRKGYTRQQVIEYFHKCAKEVRHKLLNDSLSSKFLSIDLGRFGDLTASYTYFKVNDDGIKLFQFILTEVYGNKSIDEYHNELIRAANGIEDSGYIGSIQKTIAENAKHLIVVGGKSSFQRSMIANFKAKNQNCKDCVIPICYD